MRLINSFEEKLIINSDDEDDVDNKPISCYRRTCRKCREILPFSITTDGIHTIEVQPVVVRKTPKFPSRERHMAIRRKPKNVSAQEKNLIKWPTVDDDEVEQNDENEKKTCQSCKCPREAHAIYQEQVTSVRERLGFNAELHTSKIDPRQVGYSWVPPGILTSAKIQRYFDSLPEDKVPKIGSTGQRHRERQIAYQLPKQDLALTYCKHIETQNRSSYEDFVAARNEIALDIGYVKDAPNATKCVSCDERISQSELAVIAPKFRDQMLWHPRCFTCSACQELLVDLTYCVHEDKIYCERHYAEMLKPRCEACDEVLVVLIN